MVLTSESLATHLGFHAFFLLRFFQEDLALSALSDSDAVSASSLSSDPCFPFFGGHRKHLLHHSFDSYLTSSSSRGSVAPSLLSDISVSSPPFFVRFWRHAGVAAVREPNSVAPALLSVTALAHKEVET